MPADVTETVNRYRQQVITIKDLKTIVNKETPVELALGKNEEDETILIYLAEDLLIVKNLNKKDEEGFSETVDLKRLTGLPYRFYRNRVDRKFALLCSMGGNPLKINPQVNTEKIEL